jgi:AcrR family transcriptional regulator
MARESATMSDREQSILQATLELVTEEGLTGTTIALIAKRAKASPGIIYHYFASKDEIVATLYAHVVHDYVQALLDGGALDLPWSERMRQLFLGTYDYFVAHPLALAFYEQYKNSAYFKTQNEMADGGMGPLVQAMLADIEGGLVKPWPLHVIYAMTAGVAINVAKFQIAGVISLDRAALEAIADAACRSIQA